MNLGEAKEILLGISAVYHALADIVGLYVEKA